MKGGGSDHSHTECRRINKSERDLVNSSTQQDVLTHNDTNLNEDYINNTNDVKGI